MRPVFQQIAHCCASDEPVLVRGETGSGKSHTARLIQTHGLRTHEQAVTLVAGPSTSIAELDDSLARAAGGALILEDVSQFDDTVQAELVRKIELRPSPSFPRLIATTSDDLHQAVTAGRFRSELFYRLQILEVRLPPLRQRMDDLPALLAFFLGQLKPGRNVSVSEPAIDRLYAHDWPGNLRELHNAMAFALTVSAEATVIDPAHLPSYLNTQPKSHHADHLPAPLLSELNAWLEQYFETNGQPRYRDLSQRLEAALIEQLLGRYDGKLAPMAAALQANRSTLRRKLRERVG
jgi:DNA-binding NtrC family response regulator